MKNLIIILAIFMATVIRSLAGNYIENMSENIHKMNEAQSSEELVSISNLFDRIGEKETDKWLPFYYSSYATVCILFVSRQLSAEEKNNELDKAQMQLNKALKLNENESENYALQALIYQLRITDPSLGQKYFMLTNEALAKAEALNSSNPRVYYLKATTLFYTPPQFGGGKNAAKPLFEKAATLFTNLPTDNIMPNWGNDHNQSMLEQCNK